MNIYIYIYILCIVNKVFRHIASPTVGLQTNGSSTASLNKSFFYRTHNLWNRLPLEIRQIKGQAEFKRELIIYFWDLVNDDHDSEFIYDSLDDSVT